MSSERGRRRSQADREAREAMRAEARAAREQLRAAQDEMRAEIRAAKDEMRTGLRAAHQATREAVREGVDAERAARRAHGAEPIWARPEPGARRAGYTREQIAATAIAIADAEGFEAVSMRRVARELGAGTMTLYHYVRTKDELISLMDDALMGEILVPDDELPADDWRAALTAIARRTRGAFLRHPWSFDAMRDSSGGPNGMRHFEQSLAAVAATPLDEDARFELIALVDDYVFGYVQRELQVHDFSAGDGLPPAVLDFLRAQLATGEYPHLERFVGDLHDDSAAGFMRFVAVVTDPERFERGLRRLLDGVALDLQRRERGERGPDAR